MISVEILKKQLAKLETRLEKLIEGGAAWLLPANQPSDNLAKRMIAAMQDGLHQRQDGHWVAPNLYILSVQSNQSIPLNAQYDHLDDLAQAIEAAAADIGVSFISPPVIRIVQDQNLPPHHIGVEAKISFEDLSQTHDMVIEAQRPSTTETNNAFLIINPVDIYPLIEPVTNIGRRDDNQIVIRDSRVSRVHAQVRVINGKYVIFDLNSTGGTYVNDRLIKQGILYPGDVISLGGVPLVFGQDDTSLDETQQIPSDY